MPDIFTGCIVNIHRYIARPNKAEFERGDRVKRVGGKRGELK